MSDRAPRSRRRPADGDAIRDEVAERIDEALDRAPAPAPPSRQETDLPAELIGPNPAPLPAPPVARDRPEEAAAGPLTGYVIGSYGNRSIDQHDALFVAASGAVQRKKGVRVNPRVIKAMMGVESGEDGNYPVNRCRPSDGYPGPLSCGPMQIKWPYHEQRCRECDMRTVAGHIELATHIIGDTMRAHGDDEYRAYTRAYLTDDDINGTTQQAAVAGLRRRVAQMEADAGTSPPGPVDPPPAPPPTTDPMRVISGGVAFNDAYGWLADAGLNYYGYGVGHGTTRPTQHTGVDLAMACGTPLYTPSAGVVDCVGRAGTPRWGQQCGAYADVDGGGVGNVTILLDGGVKLTLGHCRQTFVKPGDRVTAGQKVATVGSMNGCHAHVETSVERNGTYWLTEPRTALRPLLSTSPPAPADPRDGLKHWDVPGTPRGIWLPPDLTVHVLLTNKGPNRQGRPMQPTGTVYHQTGNRGIGTGAEHHAKWQRDGTQGHPNNKPGGPNIGVHAYTEDRTVVISLPWNEQGIHSGDGRNQTAIAVEECINADRDAALTERTTAHLHAAAWRDVIGSGSVTPHRCNHCPTIICTSGRWEQTEALIVDLALGAVGPMPAPIPYAPVSPLPIEWTGEDIEINGIRFTALHRVFRAAADDVPALRFANPKAEPVRRPLPKGEGFEALWVVRGDDGEWWYVTKYWSRIPARLCLPRVEIAEDTGDDVLTLTVPEEVIG